MIDREKVIKGLEHCEKQGCDGCPYYPNDDGCRLNQDALALLKEQEHKLVCPKCNGQPKMVICGICGQAVKAW